MPNIATALKAEISRLARKEVRDEVSTLKKASNNYRSQIAALKRQLDTLQKVVRRLSRTGAGESAPAAAEAEDEGTPRRFSAQRLAKTRQKLGLSAADFGALMGVSGQSIYKWEAGEVRPRRKQLEAIAKVRGLGKREVAERLEGLRGQRPVAATPPRSRAPGPKSAAASTSRTRKHA